MGGGLLPILVVQIMVGVYMVGLFKNVFQQETYSIRRLPVQFLCAGIPQNLADIGVDLVDFLVEPKPGPAGPFHDLALCNELAEVGGDRQAGQFPIAFEIVPLSSGRRCFCCCPAGSLWEAAFCAYGAWVNPSFLISYAAWAMSFRQSSACRSSSAVPYPLLKARATVLISRPF